MWGPPRMRSNAVGGGTRTLCLAWEVAIMMPLQYTLHVHRRLLLVVLVLKNHM
jgi:hypothetical protein